MTCLPASPQLCSLRRLLSVRDRATSLATWLIQTDLPASGLSGLTVEQGGNVGAQFLRGEWHAEDRHVRREVRLHCRGRAPGVGEIHDRQIRAFPTEVRDQIHAVHASHAGVADHEVAMAQGSGNSRCGTGIVRGEYGVSIAAECIDDQLDHSGVLVRNDDVSRPLGGVGYKRIHGSLGPGETPGSCRVPAWSAGTQSYLIALHIVRVVVGRAPLPLRSAGVPSALHPHRDVEGRKQGRDRGPAIPAPLQVTRSRYLVSPR